MKSSLLRLTCAISIGATSLLSLSSCVSTPNGLPDYLGEQIARNSPNEGGLTPYRLNGPYGGAISSLAVDGNTIVAGTWNGKIFRSTLNNITWSPSKIDSTEAAVNSIILVDHQFFAGTQNGILRSSDDGMTWKRTYDGKSVFRFAVFDDRLLGLTEGGLLSVDLHTGDASLLLDSQKSDEMFGAESPHLLVAGPRELFLGSPHTLLRSQNLVNWDKVDRDLGLFVASFAEGYTSKSLADLNVSGNDVFALISKNSGEEETTTLFVTKDFGTKWDQTETPVILSDGELFNSPRGIFLTNTLREAAFYEFVDGRWSALSLPFPTAIVYSVITANDQTIIATNGGVYSKRNSDGLWHEENSGLADWGRSGPTANAAEYYFTIAGGQLFRSDDQGKSWTRVTTPRVEALVPSVYVRAIRAITVVRESVFATTYDGLVAGKVSADHLSLRTPNFGVQLAKEFPVKLLASIDDELYVGITTSDKTSTVERSMIFRSNDLGDKWEPTNGLPDDVRFKLDLPDQDSSKLQSVRGVLYLSDASSSKPRVFRFDRVRNRWENISDGLRQDFITAFGSNDKMVYAAASRSVEEDATVYPQLFKLENPESSTKWTHSPTDLIGRVNALWSDHSHPEVLIAGTTAGLFWSNDNGAHFHQVVPRSNDQPFRAVSAISELESKLFINTDSGAFYVYDQIPRGKWYHQWLGLLFNRWQYFASFAFVLLLLVVLSTRLISMLLQLDLWGINKIAPAFYLLPFGRWKLYRGYSAHLLQAADIKDSVQHYVDLPYEADVDLTTLNKTGGSPKLSDLFASLDRSQRVALIADGGSGKSTLCAYLVHRCIKDRDIFGSRRLEPVVVDGLSYTGDMLSTITNALKQDRAYVNKPIVISQLAAGNLLVILDGFTEIKETYISKASSEDLPEFIRQHPDTPFIFTSRSNLPQPVLNAMGGPITVRLETIDDTTFEIFLSQYLKRGAQEVQSLIKQIEIKFKNLPRIPLLLKLVATVYDKKGEVPKDTAALFNEYAQYVLRPSATGIDEPIGLNYALFYLVRETYLKSGGDRGLTMHRGVQLLDQIKDKLAAYDIKVAPIKLLQILMRAGLYKQVRQNLKFFHDSFESYFAALVLENEFRDKDYDLLKQCSRNARLSETWQFLDEMLDDAADKQILKQLEEEAINEL
jgi:hypothetical protein